MQRKRRFSWLAVVLSSWLLVLASPIPVAAQDGFGANSQWIEIPVSQPASAGVPYFGRINNDAREDLVLYNAARGEAYVAFSDGTRFGQPQLYATGLPQFADPTYVIDLADVDGNGLDDLLIMSHGSYEVEGTADALVAMNNGTGFAFPAQPIWDHYWCATDEICFAADINGDGKDDLVAFLGQVWGALSTGTSSGDNTLWNDFFCYGVEICALGDVNGDGMADAILFKRTDPDPGEKGNVLWARSTGSAFVDVQYGHGYFCIDNESCLVGDVNGDDLSDIVLVKAFSAGVPTREILVSLSNGQAFINAEPFAWANLTTFSPGATGFGMFGLADVTGDGRDDLVEWGSVSQVNAGGSTSRTGFAVNVFPSGQIAAPVAPAVPGNSGSLPEATGYSSVAIYNCEVEQHQLDYWIMDQKTSNFLDNSGLTNAMYDAGGLCPDLNDSPFTYDLATEETYSFIAVDPQNIGCEGQNDPTVYGCIEVRQTIPGDAAGPVCHWVIGAQAAGCFTE